MSRLRFADLADAGRQLGAALTESYGGRDDALVLGIEPHGLVVDDGVESGGTATRLAALLRASKPARLVLAVPVCPREPYSALTRSYDEVIALERPLMVRSLAWHYLTWHDAEPPDRVEQGGRT